MVEPMQLHACAMHGGLVIEQGATGVHAYSAMGHRMAMHPAAEHSHHDQSSDKQSEQCSCLGDCNAGSAPVGLTAVAVSLIEPVVHERSNSDFDYSSPTLVPPHFLLPFSNGPPAGSSRA